ncbi:MAG: hypothetical protein KAR21_16315, partial [Spirochaetales bacterium]|nr:hypothetical protein [Spirochaetales bacterium]
QRKSRTVNICFRYIFPVETRFIASIEFAINKMWSSKSMRAELQRIARPWVGAPLCGRPFPWQRPEKLKTTAKRYIGIVMETR